MGYARTSKDCALKIFLFDSFFKSTQFEHCHEPHLRQWLLEVRRREGVNEGCKFTPHLSDFKSVTYREGGLGEERERRERVGAEIDEDTEGQNHRDNDSDGA